MYMLFNRAHQTHYEQFGEITGRVNVEGHGNIDLNVSGVRDHSYGKDTVSRTCVIRACA